MKQKQQAWSLTASQVLETVNTPPETGLSQAEAARRLAEVLMAHHTREGTHLQRVLSILAGLEVPARPLVRHGLVVDEILAEASAGDHDLIVIGAHRAEGLICFLLDNVAHQVICHADRTVLVAKTSGTD